MSRAAAATADHRSDPYSFGVILFEMVTGRLPFEAATISECIARPPRPPPSPASARARDFAAAQGPLKHERAASPR